VIWRWLAVMLALPTLVLILLLPLMWPIWFALWGALVVKGFGNAHVTGARKTHTRPQSRPKSVGGSQKESR